MALALGLDYSAGRIPGSAIRAGGYSLALRYVDDPARGLSSKHLRPDEYAELRAAGVAVGLVFEQGVDDVSGGFTAGVQHARRALAGAAWLGYPADGLIFMAVDEHCLPAQVAQVLDYLDGAASVLGRQRTGVYGFSEVCDAAIGRYGALWQCGHRPAPGGPVHLYQRSTAPVSVAGITCDVNELLRPLPYLTPPGTAQSGPAQPGPAVPVAAAPVSPLRGSPEDAVALISFPATDKPSDPPGGRWQDADPSTWPTSPEVMSALVPAVPGGGWRGAGSISSITCGWAPGQDGPDHDGHLKPSGWISYLRVFGFQNGPAYDGWQVHELLTNVVLVGNKSLPQLALPSWCTSLVVRGSWPGGLHLGCEWEY